LTPTVPLLPCSVAVDHTSGCPETDQRGVSRPQGAACDSGAFEIAAPAAPGAAPPPPTGQRAAALKKCKKKKSKKARKKCKRRARKLPI
jgi:hypothetical protein